MYAKLTKIFDSEKEPKLLTEILVLRDIITDYTNVLKIQEDELKARLTIEDSKRSEKKENLSESENKVNFQDEINDLKNKTISFLSNVLLAYEQIYDIIIKNFLKKHGKSIKHNYDNAKKELLKTLKGAKILNSELKKSFASDILAHYYQNK
uniref:Uncharacterized protein n=1 Tax=Meloidogyne javanica TaxID=6303 RepID=A0A915LVL0_MELJA